MKKLFGLPQLKEARGWDCLFKTSRAAIDLPILVPRNTCFYNRQTYTR
jgi:hypothetical protein